MESLNLETSYHQIKITEKIPKEEINVQCIFCISKGNKMEI